MILVWAKIHVYELHQLLVLLSLFFISFAIYLRIYKYDKTVHGIIDYAAINKSCLIFVLPTKS